MSSPQQHSTLARHLPARTLNRHVIVLRVVADAVTQRQSYRVSPRGREIHAEYRGTAVIHLAVDSRQPRIHIGAAIPRVQRTALRLPAEGDLLAPYRLRCRVSGDS